MADTMMRNFSNSIPKDTEFIQSFEFEKIDSIYWRQLLWQYRSVPFIVAGIYLISVYITKKWMENRPPMDLKNALIGWNLALVVFSVMGSMRTIPEIFYNFRQFGFYELSCMRLDHSHATAFWILLFVFSKLFEFADTFFIVLRKKKLTFLHWYHHLSIFLSCFYMYPSYYPFLWTAGINYWTHSIMYFYFSITTAGVKIPKTISMTVTTIQIAQFMVGVFTICYAILLRKLGYYCEADDEPLTLLGFLAVSYLALFVKFFVNAYIKKGQNAAAVAAAKAKNE